MSYLFKRVAGRAAAVGVTAGLSLTGLSLALATGGATPAAAASAPTGRAHLTMPTGAALPGVIPSSQNFTASLDPEAALPAHCKGDSATNHYHEFSYLLADGSDPTTVSFLTGVPSTGLGYYTSGSSIWEAKNTAVNTGQFINIPLDLQWGAAVHAGHLPLSFLLPGGAGSTNVLESGFACASPTGVVDDYWFAEVTFTSSTTDPNGFTWALTTRPTSTSVTCPASAPALNTVNCTVTVKDTSTTPEQPVSGTVNVTYTGATTAGSSCTMSAGTCSVSVAGAKATVGSNVAVAATYVGGDNNNHLTSTGSTTLAITKIVTSLAATPVVHVAVPPFATATLSDAVEGGIAGKTIVFTAGGPSPATCTATTGAGGVATCTDPLFLVSAVANLGFTASFAGDATYLASTGTAGLV